MEKVAQLSWESTCLTSRGSLVRAQQRPPLFFWGCSSAGQSAGLSRQRSRVRAPSLPPYKPRQLSRQSKGLKIPVSVVRFRVWAPCRNSNNGDVVERLRQRSAKPCTPVRFRSSPPFFIRIDMLFFFYLQAKIYMIIIFKI